MAQLNSTLDDIFIIPQHSTVLKTGYTINEYSMNENFSESLKMPSHKIYVNSIDDIFIQICLFLILISFNEIYRYLRDATFGMFFHYNQQLDMQADEEEITEEVDRSNEDNEKTKRKILDSSHSKNVINSKKTKPHDPNSLISTKKLIGKIPVRGDIIKFTELDREFDDFSDGDDFGVQRCISTYGRKYIQPESGYIDDDGNEQEGDLYIVVHINSEIPNRRTNHKKDKGETFLHVVPVSETKKNLYEESLRIFWFIDFNDLVIRQHESGAVTHYLDTLTIIGHDDRFNSDYESESSDEDSYSENDECNECEELSASIAEPNIDYQDYLYERAKYGTSDDEFSEYKEYYPESAFVRPNYYGGDPNFNDGDY
jgi:hypothetical protein